MKKIGQLAYGVACIYRIVNTNTGKQYIGSTTRFDYRFREHRRMLRLGCHHSVHLQRSWDKHGEQAFRFELVKVVTASEDLIQKEQEEIDQVGRRRLYNQSLTAGRTIAACRPVWLINAVTGSKVQFSSTSQAAAEVLCDAKKLCAITQAARKYSKTRHGFWTFDGKATLADVLARKATARRQRKDSKSHHIFAFSGDTLVSSFPTIADAAEHYRVSQSAIGNAMRSCGYRTAAGLEWSSVKHPPQKMSKKTKPVRQIESGRLVKVWESAREAAMSLTGATYRGISDAALGRSKSHRGYQWEYVKN